MKNTIKGFILGVVVCTVIVGSIGFAEVIIKQLDAAFCNITIEIDQEKITPKDVNGNIVEPFIVDGTTYLPVRAISEALDKIVVWDDETKTVGIYTKAQPVTAEEVEKAFIEYCLDSEELQEYIINSVEKVEVSVWVNDSTWSVNFDVLPESEYKINWTAGNGEEDGDWIRGKQLFLHIVVVDGVVIIESAGTGI